MSTTTTHELPCPACGIEVSVTLAESANVQRSPKFRTAILNGAFHRGQCGECGESFHVERDCLYSDLRNGILIGCFPQTRRPETAELEVQLAEAWAQTIVLEAPQRVSQSFTGPGPRIVFGLAELREKIVCFDAMMDDRIVELVKLALLDGIAGRAEAGVAGLMLVEVSDTERYLAFQPIGADNQPIGQQQLRAPLEMYDDIERSRDNLIQLFPALFQGLWIHHSVASKRFAS